MGSFFITKMPEPQSLGDFALELLPGSDLTPGQSPRDGPGRAGSPTAPFNFIIDDPDASYGGEPQFLPVQEPSPQGAKDTSNDGFLKAQLHQHIGRIYEGIGRLGKKNGQGGDEDHRQGVVPHHQGLYDQLQQDDIGTEHDHGTGKAQQPPTESQSQKGPQDPLKGPLPYMVAGGPLHDGGAGYGNPIGIHQVHKMAHRQGKGHKNAHDDGLPKIRGLVLLEYGLGP